MSTADDHAGPRLLSRTYLVHARLSEDIDLIALGNRGEIARRLVSSIDAAQRRTALPRCSRRDTESADS
ncbi:MAG: putative nucleotidyltransferase component of viral defense system [Mycobacterium sp.]|nr:putative nucleotidyltransferase component of viral defense system [Mycobacterium sp.]